MKHIIKVLKNIFFKVNVIRYLFQIFKYKIRIGNYVNFDVKGQIVFRNKNIVIRDFSEIIVYENGVLDLGADVFIGKNVEIGASNIKIHSNTSIQNECIMLGNVEIGRNCLFGPSIYVSSGFHYFKYKPELLIKDQDEIARKELDLTQNKITIEEDIWIGKNAIIINNATIGKGAIIASNTFVNKDVEPYTIVAGSPLKVIGKRLDFFAEMPDKIFGNNTKDYPYFYKGFDYSAQSISANGYVSIIENDFSIYLKSKNKKKYLVIKLQDSDVNITFSYEQQKQQVDSNHTVKFLLTDYCNDRFDFKIESDFSCVLINSIYFDDK